MADTPEGKVKKAIKKWLIAKGVWFAGQPAPAVVTGWMHMPVAAPLGVHGIPDFCGIYKFKPLYIEAKAPGKQPTDNQLARHKEIRTAGGIVIVADSLEDVINALKEHGL